MPMQTREKKQLMTAEETERTLQRLAHEILENTAGAGDVALIGIRRRGVPLAQRLAKMIEASSGKRLPIGVLDITLYRDDLSLVAEHPIVQSTDINFSVDDKVIILVDDVLYTGRTIRAALNGLFDLGRPRRIQLCVLIDRGHRELPIEATYAGRKVQTTSLEIIEVRLNEIDHEERVMLIERVP